MLAAEKPCDARAALAAHPERQQQQGLALAIISDDDEGPDAIAFADALLPWLEKVEALIRRIKPVGLLEGAPRRLGGGDIIDDLDARDTAGLRPGLRSRSALHHGRHGHRKTRLFVWIFRSSGDLCKEMS